MRHDAMIERQKGTWRLNDRRVILMELSRPLNDNPLAWEREYHLVSVSSHSTWREAIAAALAVLNASPREVIRAWLEREPEGPIGLRS